MLCCQNMLAPISTGVMYDGSYTDRSQMPRKPQRTSFSQQINGAWRSSMEYRRAL